MWACSILQREGAPREKDLEEAGDQVLILQVEAEVVGHHLVVEEVEVVLTCQVVEEEEEGLTYLGVEEGEVVLTSQGAEEVVEVLTSQEGVVEEGAAVQKH